VFSSVLVPLDGSEYSERALAAGLELARLSGARVTILTVVLAYKDAHVPAVEKLEAQTRARAEAYLKPFLDEGNAAGFTLTGRVGHGDPAEEILRAAAEEDADLIVMSTHGIGASGRHALGSVAMKVLQTATCPILMIRIPEEAAPAG
jgi:nucleotide-binding universal stress UspA family protein